MADEDGSSLRDRISRQSEEALGKLASDLLENPLVNSAITKAFSAREKAASAQEAAMALKLEPGQKLVLATHNPGKVRELAEILENRFEIVSAGDLGLPEPEETETTFVGNALLKARAAAEASGLIAVADDSGISVAALDGQPGIYSARWAGPRSPRICSRGAPA